MTDWKSSIIAPSETLEKAIQTLDRAGLRIVMVVDQSGKLLGTITDGDIRRALLRNVDLRGSLWGVMSEHPCTVHKDEPRERILAIMREKELIHMPIVDSEGTLIGLEVLPDLIYTDNAQSPILLMAGGFGKRMRPLTDACPKPMLKVGGKPILEIIIEKFVATGFREFFVSLHFLADVIVDYFGDGSRWGVNISYLRETKPLGTAGALSLLPDHLGLEPIVVMNGDVLTNVDIRRLTEFHKDLGGLATMCVQQYELQVPYGVVMSAKHRVNDIIEKPTQQFFVNAGVYVLEQSVIARVEKSVALDMPELLRRLIREGEAVNQFPIHEYWIDIGLKTHFEQAQTDIADNE
jgi:dTDP-glucose pyrophosphorylase